VTEIHMCSPNTVVDVVSRLRATGDGQCRAGPRRRQAAYTAQRTGHGKTWAMVL
jgi:hypothetical protein